MAAVRIGIVGDFDAGNKTHRFTDDALQHAAAALGIEVHGEWLATEAVHDLAAFDGLWCAPGSPYRSMEGALEAIRYARESGVPMLGTCGGFQHMVIEVARNVAGIEDAAHAETDPYASRLVVQRLECSLVGKTMEVELKPGSRAEEAYGALRTEEEFYCNFGLNKMYVPQLEMAGLRISGFDQEGEARVAEMEMHPFFVGTLFVPQARSREGAPHPLVVEFCRVAGERCGRDGGETNAQLD
ncbi:MAG: hypothetical protein PW789_04790 [Edaphobacter sp.]|uniref:CTP synthase C-terminal region-related (seleno)protein n=1 Tax=Edaphobacter sp. TaxID=1934404 RepID=UPI00239C3EDC|nr:hypothetical protein [Edaphobacter sp.]MDE1175904.1 hypothetical protein [Edaphobacter sp.]